MMDANVQKSVTYLTEVETLSQDIVTLKQQKLELSNARNKYREAFRALEQSDDNTAMLQIGRIYMELPKEKCIILLKEDINKATEDIDRMYNEIKENINKMRDLLHLPLIQGFGLATMTGKEANDIKKAFGYGYD